MNLSEQIRVARSEASRKGDCNGCGISFENGNIHKPVPHPAFLCVACRHWFCLDCHVFGQDGKRYCFPCYKRGLDTQR